MLTFAERTVGVAVLNELCSLVHTKNVKLWGLSQSPNYVEKCLALSIFKDRSRMGYGTLASVVRKWFKTTGKTLMHNQHLIRPVWKEWARLQFKLGNLTERKRAGYRTNKKDQFDGITIWIDSTDVPMQGRRKVCSHLISNSNTLLLFTQLYRPRKNLSGGPSNSTVLAAAT